MAYEDGPKGLLAAASALGTVALLGDATVAGVLAMNRRGTHSGRPAAQPPEWRAFLNQT